MNMKYINIKSILAFLITLITLTFVSCAKDSDIEGNVSVTGSISGVVKDNTDGHLLANVNVSITPDNQSKITGDDGAFSFKSLKSGSYTLTFSKTGYEDISKTVEVKTGQTVDASTMMKSKGAFSLSSNTLNFGDLNSTMTFIISNNSDTQTTFSIDNVPAWASFSTTSGTVKTEGTTTVSVVVNRDAVEYGDYTHNVVISYKGKSEGDVVLTLSMSKVKQTTPKVSIAATATDVTQNSFNIGGSLLETGGSAITAYGHCWSLSHNPTVNDTKSDNGGTQAICEFSSAVTNLAVGTTYYVRAYATNALGTAYSDEVAVTTQDVASNKWDGNIASAFEGGSGTAADPYQITTGGQLLLIKDYYDKNFVLAANIDLDNKNWLPIPDFTGTLDGAGYTIRNLQVSRTDDGQGLFARISGNAAVKNLNIKGVYIKAGSNDNIGALAGVINGKSILIENINVILTENSLILGNDAVGGIVGETWSGYGQLASLTNCHVESVSTDYTIKGNSAVGGILGYARNSDLATLKIEKSTAKVSVYGGDYTGGILGNMSRNGAISFQIASCGFDGKVSGGNCVGGIAGYGEQIVACKVDAEISGKDLVGGICGKIYKDLVACYSTGSLTCSSSNVSGMAGGYGYSVLSYTTMSQGLSSDCVDCATTASNGSGSNTATKCTNITEHLKSCYSEYATYWDFNNTWIWSGKVNGKTTNVSCPRLAWEK